MKSLPQVLEDRARDAPDELAYRFWTTEGGDDLSYGELWREVQTTAAHLAERGLRGQRAVLVYESVRDVVIAVLACMTSGSVPVPVSPGRRPRDRERLAAVARDARPAALLTTRAALDRLSDGQTAGTPLGDLCWIATDELSGAPGSIATSALRPSPGDLALLQYTSGSTSRPRGVMITHANLWANGEAIRSRFGHTRESRGVIWLPPHHDMGLMGGVFQPLFVGFPVLLMPTLAFVMRPHRWLQAISDFGATTSGGPCFAYDLCARKIAEDRLRGVDLSSWQVAFVGAEPVRSSVLRRFAARFAPFGFRPEALYPCYGLAEGTLMATGPEERRRPVVVSLDPAELEKRRARPAEASGLPFVSVGAPVPGHEVRIVDPSSRRPCAPGQIGELWLAGPSVAAGYWGDEVSSKELMAAKLAPAEPGAPGRWLRTGDLAFEHRGELYITGRIKSVIIVNGRNYHAEDIEGVAEEADERVGNGTVAALSWTVEERERLVLVTETSPGTDDATRDELAGAMRGEVERALGVPVASVILVGSRSLPRTTSGKLRREAIRQGLADGEIEAASIHSTPGVTLGIAPRSGGHGGRSQSRSQ